nr:MAG TPA: endosialidase chaperone [Caudoviricetes sp.]
METVTLLYEDYQKELAEDFKNTFLKRASDTDSSRSNDTVIDEVTDMLSTNIAVYTEKLLQRWGFSSGGEGGGGGDVTVTLDDLLKKYLSDNYVTIKGDQEVFGEKDFRKGIRIAGRRLYWDEGNDALVIEGAAYTTRWLSAKGVSPGGGGGGAGSGGAAAMYQLIDVSPNDTKDAVLGAEKDYVLTFDGSFWRGMPNKGGLSSKLFTALDKEGNEVNPDDENAEIYAIRANYSLWSVGFLSAKGISDGGTGGGGGGAVALYQLLDVEKNADITGVAGATKGSVLTFNGDKWYADKPKTAEGINRLFSALDADGNEVDLNDESKLGTITNIRANYALWSVDWISAKGKSSGGSGGGGGLISLVYGFESLGGTFDNNDNTATFNAFTINEIWKLASSGLTNVTVTGSGNAVTDVTKGSDGRSLTFTKGNMFASKSEFDALNTKFNDFLTGSDADDIINKWSELEVFLQGMKESDNLAVILQSKMDKSAFNKLFSALDSDGNEIDPSDDTKTVAAIRANFGFWGVDYVSAKGVSKGSGGTGGASALYQLVDVLANDTGDGVDGAVAGKALVFDGTHWKAADAGLNESQLSAFLSLNGYLTQTAADGRYVTSARKVIAGTGLSGGGSLTSDVTLSLGTSGVVAGTYTKVMVDVYGRVTSGTSLSATDIPSLDWSKITTGKPTTLAGYGITDAYSKTEADGKYVTIATAQTISGAKTFSAVTKTASVLPSADANSELGGTANRWNNIYSVNGTFSQNVTAKLLSASETLQIGDAYLKWDSTNNAVYVIKKDGTTPVGFYSTDWLSAKGVSMSGVQTGTLADLTDVEITNPTNGQALKYDAISQKWVNGTIDSFNVNQMWTELTKADSSKVIDASHIPTSVLDNRWVKKAGDTMTGTLTSASTTGSIIFKGLENCDITNIYTNNGTLYSDTNLAIRNGLRFNWYDTYWYIGNLRGVGTNSSGFGIANESNKLCLQVTPDYTTAPVFRSSASQGTAPLIVYSTTQVSNLNADLLDDKHGAYYQNRVYDTFVSQYTKYDYIEFLRFVIPGGQNQFRAYVVFDLCRAETGNESSGRAVLRLRRNADNTASTLFYVTNFGRSTLPELRCTTDDGITWRIWMKCNKSGYDPYIAVKIVEQYPYGYVTTQNNGTTGTPEGTRYVFTALSAGISNAANFLVNSRTLWGQPFNGTANVSGDMTGVGSITMSGDLKIGNATSPNTIYFYGTTGDEPGGYKHTFIAERLWGGTESSELVLFKGNDIGNGTDAITAGSSGPDRIRHIAAAHLFQTYTTALSGSVESVCTSSALKNLFSIASNRVISYVQLQSTIASGVAPFIVASNTVVSNLNADLLDGQHLSDLDGRYVNVTGDTMTGDLAMDNTKGFKIGWSTRVAKNSGVWIHGGADAASSTDANLRFASLYGIGWYPTIDTASGVRQGNNAMWLNVRYGNLNVAGGIKESTICIGRVNSSGEYDAAYTGEINRYDHHLFLQHHSGKYLIMCTGGGLAGIGTNSPGEKLHVAGNTRTDGYFRSTVGTGTQPYQCSSTTLNTNLNADLLDGYHQTAFSMGWTSSTKYRLDRWGGGQDKNWKKIVTYVNTDGGQYQGCKVKGTIYFITGNHNQGHVVDIPFEAIMYAYGSTANSMLNQSTLYLPPYCSWDLIRIVRYANNSWEVQVRQPSDWTNISLEYTVTENGGGSVSAGQFANTSYSSTVANNYNTNVSRPTSSRITYADRLTTGRTINGTTFDGTANITTSYWGTTRTFYTNSHDSYRASSGVNVNGSGNVTLLLPNSIRCSDWFRSTGNTGWYHENYGGGWYMTDSSYIRNYNSKILRIQTDNYETIRLVRTSSSGGCSIAFYNGGGTFRGQFGMNAASWFTFDTGTATANKNVVEISSAGGIHSKAEITAKASGSDIRLKKDIQNYNAMDIINKFRSVKYHWNDVAKANSEVYNNDYDQFGLIAQDLIAGGFEQWVRDVFHDYYTVTYERLIPVVWKGLQEVDDEVTKLRKEVVRLNKRISELEKFLCA